MATIAATGAGPVQFTGGSGKQWSIAVDGLAFTDGALGIPRPAPLPALQDPLKDDVSDAQAWLDYLSASGEIVPGGDAPLVAWMALTSVYPLGQGNKIVVEIAYEEASPDYSDAASLFDITVTATDTYTGLTTDNIQSVLGTATQAGTQPGLVHVIAPAAPGTVQAPAAVTATKLSLSGTTYQISIPSAADNSKTAFVLEATPVGDGGAEITVVLTPDATPQKTFSLTVTWKQQVTGLSLLTFTPQAAAAKTLSLAIDFAAPSGGAVSLPVAQSYVLNGGAANQPVSVIVPGA